MWDIWGQKVQGGSATAKGPGHWEEQDVCDNDDSQCYINLLVFHHLSCSADASFILGNWMNEKGTETR